MSESVENKPSLVGTFFKGVGGSAVNSGIMAAVMTGVSYVAGSLGLVTGAASGAAAAGAFMVGAMPLMVAGITLFGGVMAVKRVMGEQREQAKEEKKLAQAIAIEDAQPSRGPVPELEVANDTPGTNWADRMGRSSDRMGEILANGRMSDKDRASAILAARQAGNGQGQNL